MNRFLVLKYVFIEGSAQTTKTGTNNQSWKRIFDVLSALSAFSIHSMWIDAQIFCSHAVAAHRHNGTILTEPIYLMETSAIYISCLHSCFGCWSLKGQIETNTLIFCWFFRCNANKCSSNFDPLQKKMSAKNTLHLGWDRIESKTYRFSVFTSS